MSASTNSLKANSDGDPTQTGYLMRRFFYTRNSPGDHNNDRATTSSDDASGNGVTPKTYLHFQTNPIVASTTFDGPSNGHLRSFREFLRIFDGQSSGTYGIRRI